MGKLPNRGFWRGKPVFVTGHTGFKGGWLSSWLVDMSAVPTGYALRPDSDLSFFSLCELGARMRSIEGDVCDLVRLRSAIEASNPEIIFHLAAQPLVRRSYREPLETFATNVMGTANVLEIARRTPSVRAVVIVTSDKCYRIDNGGKPFAEDDPMGGRDPYSASKGCAELVVSAYRRSFFESNGRRVAVASARAGNAIGGGDRGEDRLVPDAIRALERDQPIVIRNPYSLRPWQHVLEPLAGYLILAEQLCSDPGTFQGAWNFGPNLDEGATVASLVDKVIERWGDGRWTVKAASDLPDETPVLRLNSSKACRVLGWRQRLSLDKAVAITVDWYRIARSAAPGDLFHATLDQLHAYEHLGPVLARLNGEIHRDQA